MDYLARVKRLDTPFREHNLTLMLIEDPVTLFYLTGIHLSTGKFLLTDQGPELHIDGRYYESATKISPVPTFLWTQDNWKKRLENLFGTPKQVFGFDSGHTSYSSYCSLKQIAGDAHSFVGIDGLDQSLRMLKEKEEIERLSQAGELGAKGFDYVLSLLRSGITEWEICVELELFWRKEGGDKLAFDPIIAFGKNTSMPHYRPHEVPLKSGQPVLIDIGVHYQGYASDMTRTIFFGEPDPKLLEIYDIVLEAQQLALENCKPGFSIQQLDETARSFIREAGYGKEFSHSLGHGIGLEVHEAPHIRSQSEQTLEPGMVITIEPGIYIPNFGGVRIEDTIAITEKGYRNLTNRDKSQLIVEPVS